MQYLKSWLVIDPRSDFSIYNLPFGIFSCADRKPLVGIAIGDQIVDLFAASECGLFGELHISSELFQQSELNPFIGQGKKLTSSVRQIVQYHLLENNRSSILREYPRCLVPQSQVQMQLPIHVGDYTDFYSSKEHASNVGRMFRGEENALLPNWSHMPVAYHGRSSSIFVSGTPVFRPQGQLLLSSEIGPQFLPTKKLDFEVETAFIVGRNTQMGQQITMEEAGDSIFGMVLFNDWSARDIQHWEYRPLGPFLGKSFSSTISPWVVVMEALEPFRVQGPIQKPRVLDYLRYTDALNYDIKLFADLYPNASTSCRLVETNTRYLYWNMSQQLVHQSSNGCRLRIGDLLASGTISGPEKSAFGSMLERSWNGEFPVQINDQQSRSFIEDFDEIALSGYAEKSGIRVGFGEARSKVLPATDRI